MSTTSHWMWSLLHYIVLMGILFVLVGISGTLDSILKEIRRDRK